MKLAQVFILLVVTHNYSQEGNLVSSFLSKSNHHIRDVAGQRNHPSTEGKNQHQLKSEKDDERYQRNRYKGQRTTRTSSNNSQRRKVNATQKIRNSRNLKELFDLLRNADINHIPTYWNQASRFMSDRSECQRIRSNPGILKPLVEMTLKCSNRLK